MHACYTTNDYLILYPRARVCVCGVIQTWSMGSLYLKISPLSKWLMDKGPGGHHVPETLLSLVAASSINL